MTLFEDGMKKESSVLLLPLVVGCVFEAVALIRLLLYPIVGAVIDIRGAVKLALCWLVFVACFLYYFLYSRKYRVVATAEGVRLRTLFRTQDIWFRDVEGYTCKRYRKTAFYQFGLYTGKKTLLINTRYRDEMIQALENAQVPERTQ